MPNPVQTIQNRELIEQITQVVHGSVDIGTDIFQASSRPKRPQGWECQDRGAISAFKSSLGLESLKLAYQQAAEVTKQEEGGCSSTTILISSGLVHVAWLGDSPVFLIGVHKTSGKIEDIKALNEPHIPTYEREDILERGGQVDADGRLDLATSAQDQVNNYSLSMSRAFGNRWLGNLLSRAPGLLSYPLSELSQELEWYALVGSDGILPESERNLMFPKNPQAKAEENDIINFCATLFKNLVNESCQPWLAENKNWAANITQVAQEQLHKMEAIADKQLVGYPAVDDTTLLLCSLSDINPEISVILTVTDGHRQGGEITAQKAIDAIHTSLASQARR
jgi:hypothetical protein